MEIKFNEVGYKSKLSYTTFTIPISITGVIGKNKQYIMDMLNSKIYPMMGEVLIGEVPLEEKNKVKVNRTINVVEKRIEDKYLNCSVLHYFSYIIDKSGYTSNTITSRIKDALRMVGLDESYLTRKIYTLSTGEVKMMMIAACFTSNPKVLVLEEPIMGLDYNNKKKVLKLIRLLREKYHKTILIFSDDVDFLYQFTDNVIFAEDCNRIHLYNTSLIFTDVEALLDNRISVPKLVKFSYKANLKGAKLHYHKDIRDLIKDIYKHV